MSSIWSVGILDSRSFGFWDCRRFSIAPARASQTVSFRRNLFKHGNQRPAPKKIPPEWHILEVITGFENQKS
jgi:hypothetical protein